MNLLDFRYLLFLSFLTTYSTFSFAGDTITVSNNYFQIDHSKKLILVNQDISAINSQTTEHKSTIFLDEYYRFSDTTNIQLSVGTSYHLLNSSNENYFLYFTQLPIISIHSDYEICNEPRVLARFLMSESNGTYIISNIGIEQRGWWSLSFPKNSFRVEFWNDTAGFVKRKLNLLGMRYDDDWNLQAMYNEPLRLRSKVNNEIWKEIHSLYYQSLEPEAESGIKMEYAELFLNGQYRGLYALSERVDRSLLKLTAYDGNIQGELYKGKEWGDAVVFASAPDYDNTNIYWGGFEYSYPDEEIEWYNLHKFVYFVVNSANSEFYAQYSSEFEVSNAVDYFIFLNLLKSPDNIGKNIMLAKYKPNDPYFYIPMDLDAAFGTDYNGNQTISPNGILTNGLYNRLIHDCATNGFSEKLKQRWNDLRASNITYSNIYDKFIYNHDFLVYNGVYERESIAWNEYQYNVGHLDYISNWINERLVYLDNKFSEPCVPINVNEINIPDAYVFVFPNPANDNLFVKLNKENLPAEMTILNSMGQNVYRNNLINDFTSIDLSAFINGIYFIIIQLNDQSEIRKLIIQR